jgi:hypothetical protein
MHRGALMSDTRALRDRLEQKQAELRRAKEHAEKLRAHQARELEPLRQQLEEARREVAGLRGRLRELETARVEPAPAADAVLPEPVTEARSPTMLIALVRSPSPLEPALPQLTRVLNLAPVDVRLRLAQTLPAVVARLPSAQAEEMRAAIRARGFLAVSHQVSHRAEQDWMTVKRLKLEEQGLSVEGAAGPGRHARYAELRLLVRGRRIVTQVEKKQEAYYDHDTEGRSSTRTFTTTEQKREQVENFLWVLGKDFRAAFTQTTQFMGLGEQLAPTVHGNLERLMSELRRRATHVVVDERLMQMPRYLMPLVDPGRSQELFAELLFQAVDEGLWV